MKDIPLKSNTNSEKLEVYSLSAHVTWLLFTNKHSMLMIYIYLQIFCSFQPTFRFQMPFLTFKARIISSQQIEQSWFLETYKLFAPTQKQLAHPLFSSNSAPITPLVLPCWQLVNPRIPSIFIKTAQNFVENWHQLSFSNIVAN